MGLLLVRQGKLDQAVPYLGKAAEMNSLNTRYSYVYAVALFEIGQQELSIKVLESAVDAQPGNRELVSALASYYEQLGYKEKLQELIGKHTQ